MEPLPAAPESFRAARRILVVAALIHLFFFVNECRGQLRGLFAGLPVASGSIVRGYDGHGYYAWLRSLLVDGDWQFGNEFDYFRATQPTQDAELSRTPTGRVMNQWSVGPALLWSPLVVPVHLVAGGDGYSPAHQLAIATTTFGAGLLTLFLFYRIAQLFALPVSAACTAAIMTLGTSVVAYGSVDVAMAHGPATMALAAFVLAWLRSYGEMGWRRWLVLGFLLGIAALFRWQLVTFAVLPAFEALVRWHRPLACAWPFGVGFVVGFLPQMVAWQIVYGEPLVQPHGPAKNWLHPALVGVLFSTDRGFFYWTPLTLVAFVGLWYSPLPQGFGWGRGQARLPSAGEGEGASPGGKPHPLTRTRSVSDLSPLGERWKTASLLALAALTQIYVLAAMYAPPVALGGSFGFRFLVETCAVLVPGMALLARSRVVLVAALLLVMGNLLLLGVHRYAIDGFHEGDPAAMLHAVTRYFALRPLDAIAVMVAWACLAVAMVRGVYEIRD